MARRIARLALGREFGADEVISIERTDPAERLDRVRALTDGRGADIVMEFTGHPGAFNEGVDMVRRGGRYLVVGQLGEGEVTMAPSMITKKNLRVIGSFSGDARSYWQALDFAARWHHRIPFEKMISNRFSIDEVNTALGRMRALAEIKPIIEFA